MTVQIMKSRHKYTEQSQTSVELLEFRIRNSHVQAIRRQIFSISASGTRQFYLVTDNNTTYKQNGENVTASANQIKLANVILVLLHNSDRQRSLPFANSRLADKCGDGGLQTFSSISNIESRPNLIILQMIPITYHTKVLNQLGDLKKIRNNSNVILSFIIAVNCTHGGIQGLLYSCGF